jgi:hypothetical protein
VPAAPAPVASSAELLVAAGRERTVLISGLLAGMCVFFAPLVVLALGLMAGYLAYVASDGQTNVLGVGREFVAADFRSVFAPAIHEAPLLVSAGLIGAMLAQFRRWLARRADPAFLAAGIRPFFPEFAFLYALLVALTVGLAATHGGWLQLERLMGAAPVYLLFMGCATWLAHAVWNYSFRNLIDLLATAKDRDAASALRGRARPLAARRSAP